MKIVNSNWNEYINFYKDLKSLILNSKHKAWIAVNNELINLYWNIWALIIEKQEKSKWWDDVIWELGKDLEKEFGRWFWKRNLNYIRKFYLTYRDNEKVQSLVAQINWTHNIRILDKCNIGDDKDTLRRIFYIKQSIEHRWSVRALEQNLSDSLFEKWALKQVNFDKTLPENLKNKASSLVQDSYNFSLLNMEEPYLEKKLEDLLVHSIENTLWKLWKHFCFLWRQIKVEIWNQDFYIDLLFFHRKLKCLVAIELKTTEFKAEYWWKMSLYLSALEEQEMLEWENPPIWIILVKDKNRTIVEYTLKDTHKPIWVASYITKEELPKDLVDLLPTKEDIERELELLS